MSIKGVLILIAAVLLTGLFAFNTFYGWRLEYRLSWWPRGQKRPGDDDSEEEEEEDE
jgi:hypothetical protein